MTAARVDASGVALSLPAPPRRIVSLIPSTTETLCRLGLADALVGITVYCVEPREVVATKTRIGGEKDPDLDKIRALAPDLVIANIEENVREHIATLRGVGHPGVGDLSAHGGGVAGHDPRAGRGDRHRRARGRDPGRAGAAARAGAGRDRGRAGRCRSSIRSGAGRG